ncbi:MAG: ligand-binding sensor domain-containing protein [Peptostreptococcaceae bacterium]
MINIKKLAIKCIIPILIVMLNFDVSTAYNLENINFRSLTIEDGLSQSTVETMIQDNKGYIWIGTNDGLNKYNGYDFIEYSYDINDKNSISNNYIVDIVQDQDNFIWVSTNEGLNKIDPSTNKITRYTSLSTQGNLSNNRIGEILVTSNNDILVTTTDGLNLYNKNSDRFTRLLGNSDDLPSQYIHSIHEDASNNIWLGTENGLAKLDDRFNLIDVITNDKINGISDNAIFKIFSDSDNILWVGTFGSGLFKIDPSTLNYSNYTYDPNNENSIPENVVRDILRDSTGNLWIATYDGLAKYDEIKDNFIVYKNKSHDRNSLIDSKTYCLIEDKSGLIWAGTYKGISLFNSDKKFKHYKSDPFTDNSLSSDVIHGIYEDNQGYVWIGTASNGVNIISKSNDNIAIMNSENSKLCNNVISDITGLKNEIYIGTNDGLNIIDTKNNNIISLNTENNLPSSSIRSLYVDSKNNLWIGTKKGLAIMDISTKKVIDITPYLEENGVSDLFIRDIYESKDGKYYLACFLDGGLVEINLNNDVKIYKHENDNPFSLTTNSIRTICENSKEELVIGTSHGLNILDRKTSKFYNYTVKDGLPNNNIYGVLIDDNDNIWMSTNSGISKFNSNNEIFENFTIIDGLQDNEFNGNAYYKNNNGEFYFGGINGFNVFNPEDVHTSKFYPTVIFDEFQIDGIYYDDISNLKLKSSENNLSLSFFLNDYKNLNGVQYYYKLEGLDDDWISTSSNKIVYGNLASGNYTFKIKALSYNGLISQESSTSFTIHPPFWRSSIAICGYIIILFIIFYLNISKVKRLDKLVDNRTKELKYEMQKNKNLFKKIISLEKSKNNYFVNLSHELRTPLNVINGTVQLIKNFNDRDELNNEKIDYYADIMNRNCKRLLNIINNIIDTSKLQSNNYIINKKEEDIVYIIEETILSLKDYIENKGIEFTIDTNTEEKIILCDKYEIERCIVNLIGNAVKFTPSGGSIDVFIEDFGSSIKISVKDTGIGISPENMKIIFDKFNQVIDASSEIKGGSGLGLTITKHLIELHNGNISVNSKLGEGSEFIIVLPTL